MRRRQLNLGLVLALPAALPWAGAAEPGPTSPDAADDARWAAIESSVGGRLGVAVLDTGTGITRGHRLDERFPMCSTFKWLLAALVLQRVDDGKERLDARIRFGREALPAYSPVTEQHVGKDGMTIAELCEAAVTVSDNGAANLLLARSGGPAAVTRQARALGDPVTRLDRTEPALNESRPGDPRDTTAPRAMSVALRSALLGNGLSPSSRAQLTRWMEATRTGSDRIRAGLPAGWRAADKTGTGERGSTNDVAVLWPPQRPPLVVVAYLTECAAPPARRSQALAAVGRAVAAL
jgi:beta-lactamase class A